MINFRLIQNCVIENPAMERVTMKNVRKNVISLAVAGWLLGFAVPAAAQPFAYVANAGRGNVSVIDTATNTVVATVLGGAGSKGVAITADGALAYVTNAGSDNVSVIDTATNTVVAKVLVGSVPIGVAITPTRGRKKVTEGKPFSH